MAVNWGSDSLLWPALLGASGGLLGAAPGQSQFGSGFQGLLGGLHLGAQMQRARREEQQASQLAALRNLQMEKEKADIERRKQWQAMFGGVPPTTAPTTVPPMQVASAAPDATIAALTPPAGERAGPTPQAANRLNMAATNPIEILPANLRPLVAAMGPEQGAAFLAQQAAKQMETGAWEPIGDGLQRNRLTGEIKPISPKLVEANINPTISMPPQRKAEDEIIGKRFGEIYAGLQSRAMSVPSELSKLERLDSLLDRVNTGKFAGTTLELKRMAKAAGIDLEAIGVRDDVAPAQAAHALSREMALELRNPQGGAGMPGALSDRDREFLESMVPGIEMDPQGRKLIIETRRRLLKREQEVAKRARDYRKKHGTIDEGFFDELAAFSEKNPLFADLTMPQPASAQPAPFGAPAVGTIEDGYRFKGGNPADPNNWERVQ